MKQPHTEETVRHTDDEQNTGTHKRPGAPDEKGADRFGVQGLASRMWSRCRKGRERPVQLADPDGTVVNRVDDAASCSSERVVRYQEADTPARGGHAFQGWPVTGTVPFDGGRHRGSSARILSSLEDVQELGIRDLARGGCRLSQLAGQLRPATAAAPVRSGQEYRCRVVRCSTGSASLACSPCSRPVGARGNQ